MTSRKRRHMRSATKHRKLVFVDIENYVGHPMLSYSDVESARRRLEQRFNLGVEDQVVVGTSHERNFLSAKLAWNGPRHVLKRGRDGADAALVNAACDYDISSYEETYIVSSDGYFADLASRFSRAGSKVVVVKGAGSLSHKYKGINCSFA